MQRLRMFGVALSPFSLLLLAGLPVAAAQQAEVIHADHHGLSAAMRDMPIQEVGSGYTVRPRPQIPGTHPVAPSGGEDSVLQDTAFPMVATTPGLNILGLGVGF